MYISKKEINGVVNYFICETYAEGGKLKSRVLFELGADPKKYILYPGGNSFYIDETVELTIASKGYTVDTFELEALFWPYLDPRLKRILKDPVRKASSKRYKREELLQMQSGIHIFDKRRLHFLRFGVINQDEIDRYPYRFFNRLLGKSRDEIECMIDEAERTLKRSELKTYVYTIFNLKSYFSNMMDALVAPFALDQDRVDDAFLEELCRLNSDREFWGEDPPKGGLHSYLKKYVIMYFDNEFPKGRRMMRGFDWRQFKQHLLHKREVALREALKVLKISEDEYRRMTKRQLRKRFRRLAHQYHPDKGGSEEKFIQLSEAYQRLLEEKKKEKVWR
jgi:hypothetical protein